MTGVTWPGDGVRPTLRCIREDLGLVVPTAEVLLERLPHELVEKAQRTPDVVGAGAAERIAAVQDRIWLKLKAGAWRGAVLPPAHIDAPAQWWLCAAGQRQADSDQHDFYARFSADCARRGASTGRVSGSSRYLPLDEDARRLQIEQALAAVRVTKLIVRGLARDSLQTGRARTVTFDGWDISILIRTDGTRDASAYIVLSASGLPDPKTYAALLSAVPGVAPEDWLPEPSDVLGIQAPSGAVVFSALISAEAQAALLAE